MNNLFQDLQQKKAKICVVGLGYVGLPIALEFARKFSVIGFDINEKRVAQMRQGIDPSKELSIEEFKGGDIYFTASLEEIREASFFLWWQCQPLSMNTNTPTSSRCSAPAIPLVKCSRKVIMWYLNLPFIQAVPKKTACLFWSSYQA